MTHSCTNCTNSHISCGASMHELHEGSLDPVHFVRALVQPCPRGNSMLELPRPERPAMNPGRCRRLFPSLTASEQRDLLRLLARVGWTETALAELTGAALDRICRALGEPHAETIETPEAPHD